MELLSSISLAWVAFSRHLLGLAAKPYTTMRVVVEKGEWGELGIVGFLCLVYFSLSSLVKTQAMHPLLLTKQFIKLSLGGILGYLLIIGVLSLVAAFSKPKNFNYKGVAVAWGYSLIPTGIWFLLTSFLYVVLPPPRTQAFSGVLFSLVYLTMSAVLFFWKAELYYLVLRFGLRLDLVKIVVVTSITLPIVGIYSVIMLYCGIFRVPFI
jgi:hypothetical protein